MADLLFLAHRVPYPPDRGDKIRSFNILKHLAESHRVHLAAFADDAADVAAAEALRGVLGAGLGEVHVELRPRSKGRAMLLGLVTHTAASVLAFGSKSMTVFVDEILAREPIGRIYAFSGQMAQYAPVDRPFIMDFVDMDSEKFSDYAHAAKGLVKFAYGREAKRLFAFEREAANRAVISLFVSEAEAELFRERTKLPLACVQVLENGIDLDYYRPEAGAVGDAPLIVFTGQMDYPPNIEAAAAFALITLPLVRRRNPQARFAIVGRNPDPALMALDGKDGVQVTGAVDDVRPWLARACLVVAPLRIARGVQNKVLEAMAMGRPVVASPQAHQGIDAEPGRDLIVADGPAAEADTICELLSDPIRAEEIGRAARLRVEARYAWGASLAPLDAMLERI